ncbi:MAG: metallophosphoesterase [bacterium]|nr:metallophosphoesterase [bacterium]
MTYKYRSLNYAALISLLLLSGISGHGAAPPPNRDDDRILASEPEIRITTKGELSIRVRTRFSCLGGEVLLGVYPVAAELNYPAYRWCSEFNQEDSLNFIAKFNLPDVVSPKVDINDQLGRHGGELALRISFFVDGIQNFERKFSYGIKDNAYFRVAGLIEGPLVDCVTDTSAIISWAFDAAVPCTLRVEPGSTNTVLSAESRFETTLNRLTPSTRYRYAITWSAEGIHFQSHRFEFITAPPASSDQNFKFVVLSDMQAGYNPGEGDVEGVNFTSDRALLNHAFNQKASLILITGDLVSGYTSDPKNLTDEFNSFKRISAPVGASIPIYEGMGNHDQTFRFLPGSQGKIYLPQPAEKSSEAVFAQTFVNPQNGPEPTNAELPPYRENVYSLDWGNSHFTMLNNIYFTKSSAVEVKDEPGEIWGTLDQRQLGWLDRDLAAARERGLKHLFIFMHEPAFPCGGHTKDAMWWEGKRAEINDIRNQFWRLLCKYRVLALFVGHEHNYCRVLIDRTVDPNFDVPIWQIINGGGGGGFYNVDSNIPWVKSIRAFSPLQHDCLVEVQGDSVNMVVTSIDGTVIETVRLDTRQ